jgi:hypothetical protein
MSRFFGTLTGIALVTLTTAATASAQSANINATATVLQPLTVAGVRDLAFGNVYPGVNKTTAYSAATGGKFSLIGTAAAQVSISFTLPTSLTSGANTLPIGTWTGCYNTADATSGCTAFTPSSSSTTANLAPVGGTLYVFVGATITPAGNQVPGSYTAQVTMNAAYTGL